MAYGDDWHALLKKFGAYELARKIAKLPSYRAYAQRYPYDGSERPLSLEQPIGPGPDVVQLLDLVAGTEPGLEPAQIDRERVEEFKQTLSPRQKEAVQYLEQGYKPKEFYKLMNYKNTGGVRYLKWSIRRKYEKFVKEIKEQQ